MLASTSSIVITGSFRGDGSGLSGITVDSGSLVTTASFNAFTASYYVDSGSFDQRIDGIIAGTGSYVTVSDFNVYTGSIDNTLNSIEATTASQQLQINQKLDTGSFNSYTGSNDSKVNSLIAATGSYATTSSLTTLSGSIATTDLAQNNRLNSIESITGSLQLQINQKLNTGSFNAYTSSNDTKVNDLISKTGSYVTETESGSFVTSVTGSSATITVTKGNGTNNTVTVNNVNNAVSSSFAQTALSASYAPMPDVSYFATTGSNNFIGQQNIDGGVQISGSLKMNPTVDPDPTGLNLTSSYIFQSGSNTLLGNDLYFRQNGNITKLKWLEGQLASGLLYGGVVSWSGSNVYVSKGSGIVVNYNAVTGSEIGPIIDYVQWNDITGSVNVTGSQVTYLLIDDTGSLQQQTQLFTPQQFQESIPLGAIAHFDNVSIQAFGGDVNTAYGQQTQTNTFIDAFGPMKLNGYILQGQTGTLSLSVGSGTSFIHGGFYKENPNDPSVYTSNSAITGSIVRCYTSGSETIFDTNGGNFHTTVDPTQWDDSGTLDTVGSSNWTIQRVFSYPQTNTLYIYYGQTTYTTLLNALQYLASDPFVEGTATQPFTTFIGYLILKGNTTDLTNTTQNSILQAGLYRGTVGGSTGGAAVATNLEDLADVTITSPSTGQALIYNAGIWVNGTPVSSSFATNAGTAISSSFATNSDTAVSSSYAQNADTAVSSSFASTAISSSQAQNAVTASFALNVTPINTGSFATTGSNNFIGTQNITGSLFASGSDIELTATNLSLNGPGVSVENFLGVGTNATVGGNLWVIGEVTASLAEGNVWVGNSSNLIEATPTSSLSVASAVSSSQAQNSVTSSYSDYAVSSSQAQNAITSSFSDFAVSSSQAENAVSASWAPTPDVSYLATTGSNNFFGTENITGSLIVTGSATIRQANMFFDLPHRTDGFNYITASNTGNSNLIFAGQNVATSVSQSLQLSGSNNFILGRPQTNETRYVYRIASGSYNNFSVPMPRFTTGSNAPIPSYRGNINLGTIPDTYVFSTSSIAGVAPQILNNYIAGTLNLNLEQQYRYPTSISNNNINGAVNLSTVSAVSYNTANNGTPLFTQNSINGTINITNAGTGSYSSLSNNNINAALTTINNIGQPTGSGMFQIQNNNIGGNNFTITVTGSYNGNGVSRFLSNNFIGGLNHNLRLGETAGNGSLINSLIFGSNLSVSASHADGSSITTGNASSTVMLGAFNETGSLADTTQARFVLGTGTAAANRRTSLYVSSSGQFHVRSGMVQSGSLELVSNSTSGSMNLTGSLNVTGTLQVKGGGLVVSGGQAQFNNEIVFNGGTYFSQPMENFIKLNATSPKAFVIDNFNLNNPSYQSYWVSTVDTGSQFVEQKSYVSTGTVSGSQTLNVTPSASTYELIADNAKITGSLSVSGKLKVVDGITGSINGNVVPLSITSNTASLNLNDGNFFTIILNGGVDTRIEPSNLKAGQTVNILVGTTGSATVSFPSSVKQVSGSTYVPSTGTTVDILTLVSFDSSYLYLANVKNLI
jgi:hypothetical protein